MIMAMLAACSDSGGDASENSDTQAVANEPVCGFDPATADVTAEIDPLCAGCSVDNVDQAADGDYEAGAVVTVNSSASGDGVLVRVTRTQGPDFGSGSTPGFFWSRAQDGGAWCDSIRLIRDGEIVQDGPFQSCTESGSSLHGSGFITANQAFDAVEIQIVSGESARDSRLSIDEICADF